MLIAMRATLRSLVVVGMGIAGCTAAPDDGAAESREASPSRTASDAALTKGNASASDAALTERGASASDAARTGSGVAAVDVTAPAVTPAITGAFDAATVAVVRARIVVIPNRKSWVPCGGMHSIGALEVEVLEVGEPAPRLVLMVSCPVDGKRHGSGLTVGATITATLHARKQSWPGVRGLPEGVPRRYVASYTDASAVPEK